MKFDDHFNVEIEGDGVFVRNTIVVRLKHTGEIVLECNESFHDSPEDCTWDRLLRDVFEDGVRAGLKLSRVLKSEADK